MKKKKRKYIKYPKERAVLSDVLPYEVPITFSNRYFFSFLVKNKIELNDLKLSFEDRYDGDDKIGFVEILKILFGIQDNPNGNYFSIDPKKGFSKIPFHYNIAHKENDFRELVVIHPFNQLSLIEFYEKYKELIIYYSKISNFSIRKPDAIAKYTFFNDKIHHENKGNKDDTLELSGKEYDNLKTFFTYKKYTNIYRFYEDYRYQRAEKKYKLLFNFDITKCFDSIYSHSISWALLGKQAVKDYIGQSRNTFPGLFDRFMQNSNYGETNGIVIGPEFSRIFAELILQKIDKNVEKMLRKDGIYLRKHYEMYRYVDDYFLFCDDEQTKDKIMRLFKLELKEYKMSINNSKFKQYDKPIITELSIAKQKINSLFEKKPSFELKEINDRQDELTDEGIPTDSNGRYKYSLCLNPNRLATDFKIIIKESRVSYKDVLNYTLAILDRKIEKQILLFEKAFKEHCENDSRRILSKENLIKKGQLESQFTTYIVNFLDFIFFLYSVSPRVNSTIKISHILSKIIKYFKGKYKIKTDEAYGRVNRFSELSKSRVFKKISDEISLILDKNQINRDTQVEVLYLLVVLKELGKEYRLKENVLARHLGIICENDEIEIADNHPFNYFTIVVLLYYIGDSPAFQSIKACLLNYIGEYLQTKFSEERRAKSSEAVLLMLDLLVCPFVENTFKEDWLALCGISPADVKKVIGFRKYQKYWFTKWEKFDLGKELLSKRSQEVYS